MSSSKHSPEIALTAEDVSKAYRIWRTPSARLVGPMQEVAATAFPAGSRIARWLRSRAARQYRDFYAVRNVSLTVRRGESVGIIGRNGSGKSTLLQIIAGTLRPSEGAVVTVGRVAALLELGSGFNPEFTGRENVFLNAAVLGLTREQVEARYSDIVAFSEIGEFIDEPVKTYSSGMAMRLAFAVAAHVDPDILIIDEALSVGDARFQLKCARAIDQFLSRGVTLLLVSHDPNSIKRLCQRAILLEKGRLVFEGKPNEVTNLYTKLLTDGSPSEAQALDRLVACKPASSEAPSSASARKPTTENVSLPPHPPSPSSDFSERLEPLHLRIKALESVLKSHTEGEAFLRKVEAMLRAERSLAHSSGTEFSYGGELGRILDLSTQDADGHARRWFTSGDTVVVRMEVESFEQFTEPIFALTIKNVNGVEIYGTNTLFSRQPARPMMAKEHREVTFTFPVNLMPGHYFLSFGFTHFFGDELVVIHRRYDALKIEVHGRDRSFGIANLHARIEERTLTAAAPLS